MAQSNYFNPKQITQTPDDVYHDVPWVIEVGQTPYTERDILFLVNTSNGGQRNRTWYLHFTDFDFDNTLPAVITGIEVRLKTRRNGRVFDETIALSKGTEIVSDNKVSYQTDGYDHYPVDDFMIYGGPDDLWGSQLLSAAVVRDPAFGITFRFQGHPYTPHKCGMAVDSVKVCFYG